MSIIVDDNFESFLYKNLSKSLAAQKLRVSDEAGFYVHQLLTEYLNSEKFKTVSGFGNSEQPLAIMVKEAYDAPTTQEQIWRFIAIGDHSFFVSSFFSGHINRKFEDLGYCVGIGSNSYLQACGLYTRSERDFAKLYRELGVKFVELVKVATSALGLSLLK